jgi:hypothetical protein
MKVKKICVLLVIVLTVLFILGIANPVAAQELTEKDRELEIVRAAIRALPDAFSVTDADRPAVLEANRLATAWLVKYNVSRLEICTLSGKLMAVMELVGGVGDALPPTGGSAAPLSAGLLSLFAGLALLVPRKKSR